MRTLEDILKELAQLCEALIAELEAERMPAPAQREALRLCLAQMRAFTEVEGLAFVLNAAGGWLDIAEERDGPETADLLDIALGQLRIARREIDFSQRR